MELPRIAHRLFGRAHAIEPQALRAILSGPLAARVLSGVRVSEDIVADAVMKRRQRLAATAGAEPIAVDGGSEFSLTPAGVAIIPVCGVLANRFEWLSAACGWTTYQSLAASLDAALADARVRSILLDVESPGGEAAGMLDIADRIIAARAEKPIWAVADVYACSAAYAIAGSASRLLVPRLGQVGAIGCLIVHIDQSSADLVEGLSYTAVYSGARKIDGWGHAPLSGDARAAYQADADHVRAAFAELVGRQGRISASAALATEAQIYSDQDAVNAGLADGVGSFEDAITELSNGAQAGVAPVRKAPADDGWDEVVAKQNARLVGQNSRGAPKATSDGTDTAEAIGYGWDEVIERLNGQLAPGSGHNSGGG